MQKIKENLVGFGTKIRAELHNPVHDALSWLAVAAVSASSFLIMTTVLAQTQSINEPFDEPSFSTSTPIRSILSDGACVPGEPCPEPENSFNGQASSSQLMDSKEGFMQKPAIGMDDDTRSDQESGEEDIENTERMDE